MSRATCEVSERGSQCGSKCGPNGPFAAVVNAVRPGFYLDSVALMRISAQISSLPGVAEAVLMIGTPANKSIVHEAGLLLPSSQSCGANDLLIAIGGDDTQRVELALAEAEAALDGDRVRRDDSAETLATDLAEALARQPQTNLLLVSTPGEYAAEEARAALNAGCNVMIFSDNVSLEAERALKQQGHEQGLLVMGPDCGTAIIAGVPLAFCNIVPDGAIGVIAASGTGLQEFSVLVSRLGGGIHHGIGVGGRDLSDTVGALSTLAAIDLLEADPAIDVIVLISKPPGERAARHVFTRLAGCSKPVIACVLGFDVAAHSDLPLQLDEHDDAQRDAPGAGAPPALLAGRVRVVATLERAAMLATGNGALCADPAWSADGRQRLARELASELRGLPGGMARQRLCGLFTGGTLCTEARLVLEGMGLELSGLEQDRSVPVAVQRGHCLVDLGDDRFTVGRPHPMIEPATRVPHLQAALSEPTVAVVLIDLVLGLGAHGDPASAVVSALSAARAAGMPVPIVVGSVCGTDADPQGRARQQALLESAGVVVAPCNAEAARLAGLLVGELAC
ncbi:MAG: oxidoreductase [Gammaproteobacteria bacterium]|nr:oxidoreductase [Gammaproteobacteria bacterium]